MRDYRWFSAAEAGAIFEASVRHRHVEEADGPRCEAVFAASDLMNCVESAETFVAEGFAALKTGRYAQIRAPTRPTTTYTGPL